MKKISTGIAGLDSLLDGGVYKGHVISLVGSAGTGKTLSCLAFLRQGIAEGHDCIYISLEESAEQLIREAEGMGWGEFRKAMDDEKFTILEASGKNFSDFIKNDLPLFVDNYRGPFARIAVDPLAPVIWSIPDKYSQRNIISFMFNSLKKIGTVMVTVEEHTPTGEETLIPIYLSDTVIHLNYAGLGATISRTLRIIKSRNSWHSHISHPYSIIHGIGPVILSSEQHEREKEPNREIIEAFNRMREDIPRKYRKRVEEIIKNITVGQTGAIEPEKFISLILKQIKGQY